MRNNLVTVSLLALTASSLAACGGGSTGGGVVTTPPPVTQPPVVTPPVTPTDPVTPVPPTNTEFTRSTAANVANADYAYDRGITGDGVTIAIIDSGIDTDSPEFAGRVSDASKSFSSTYATCGSCPSEQITFGLDDTQGHGTLVASIAAGGRNGTGMHGVAYDADILALKIAAPDMTTGGTPTRESGVNPAALAPAIRYAVDNGAFVINVSMNGSASGQMAADQRSAMDHVRANNRLLVQSISNETGDSFAGTITENLIGSDLSNREWFLFGIGVNANLQPRSTNGTPGALADRTLSVASNQIEAMGINGIETVAGNSFAAPAIAGAAALLKEYWPQLGGREISGILLSSATDLGAPGVDQVYGAGLLNIENAMKAQAPTMSLSSMAAPAPVADTALVFSPAFGGSDANVTFSSAGGRAVALDRFGRDYSVDMSALSGSMRPGGVSIATLAQPHTLSYVPSASDNLSSLGFTSNLDGRPTNTPAGQFGYRLSPNLAVSGTINGSIDSSDMMTGSMLRSSGIATFGSTFNVFANDHQVTFGNARSSNGRSSSTTQRFRLVMPNGFLVGLTSNRETGSALGMQGTGAFNIDGSRSIFATGGWSGDVAGFRLTGEAMIGRTSVETRNSLIEFAGPVLSTGFRLQAERNLFGGSAVFGVTSPLKVEHAQVRYTLPVAYDLDTRSLVEETQMINLAPDAREVNLELGWSRSFGKSHFSLGAAHGFNTGNVRGQQSNAGWIRLGAGF